MASSTEIWSRKTCWSIIMLSSCATLGLLAKSGLGHLSPNTSQLGGIEPLSYCFDPQATTPQWISLHWVASWPSYTLKCLYSPAIIRWINSTRLSRCWALQPRSSGQRDTSWLEVGTTTFQRKKARIFKTWFRWPAQMPLTWLSRCCSISLARGQRHSSTSELI